MTTVKRTVVTCLAIVTVGQLPAFLTGALAVQMRAELGFSVTLLGLAISGFFIASATTSALAGHVVERIGWPAGLRLGMAITIVSLTGVALLADTWLLLAGLLALAGIGNAVSQPASNLALVRVVPPEHYGVVFGVKQSAILMATLLGGLSVPAIALTIGWRWTYAFAAIAGAVAAVGTLTLHETARTVPGTHPPSAGRPSGPSRANARVATQRLPSALPVGALRALLLVATVGFGSAMVGNAFGAFLVSSAVADGMLPGRAGLLLAASSLLGLAVRVGIGWLADQRPIQPLRAMAVLLLLGSAGTLLLAFDPMLVVVGALLAVGAGWGWPGLYNLAVVRAYPSSAAAATGVSQTGIYLGAAIGPIVLGVVADTIGFAGLWFTTTAIALVSAAMALTGHHALARQPR